MKTLTEEQLIEHNIILKKGRLHWFHWSIIISSLFLTLTAWYISKKTMEEKISLQFNEQAMQVVELVTERMQRYEDGLAGGVAVIQTLGGDISYHDWKKFSHSLQIEKKYPGINGIGVIYYVSPDGLDDYLANQQIERSDYKIHPEHSKNEFWPITYIEPLIINEKAVGLDMAHEVNRYTSALRARDNGSPEITGPIILVQDSGQTPGFLFYSPFYKGGTYETVEERKSNFIGMVYAPFVMKNLMEGTLRKDKRHVGIKITDGDDVLYDEHNKNVADMDPNPLYRKSYEVDMYGRSWIFDIESDLSFRRLVDSNQPIVILVGGIIIDSLLLVLFILLASTNKRAVNLIDSIVNKK